MVKIIDATLSMLDEYKVSEEKIREFIACSRGMGIFGLQISSQVYKTLKGQLPEGFHYFLQVSSAEYMAGDYAANTGFDGYFVPQKAKYEKDIRNYQINDIQDPVEIDSADMEVRITGLDGILLAGYDEAYERITKRFAGKEIILCPENTYSCATALAYMFLEKKGRAVISTYAGIGNKAHTEQLLLAMHVNNRYLPSADFSGLRKLRTWTEEITKEKISDHSPVIGSRIFYVESGVHLDGICKKPSNYEPYAPDLVGLERKVILGKSSGRASVEMELKEISAQEYPQIKIDKILEKVKKLSIRKCTSVSEAEFARIVKECDACEKDCQNC